VAELLKEYELRTRGDNSNKEQESPDDPEVAKVLPPGGAISGIDARRRLGTPPVCQDVTSSPKRFPRKQTNLSNGDDGD